MTGQINPIWLNDFYTVRQKVLALGKTYFIDDAANRQIGYTKMKVLKFKEDIRIYTDDSMTTEILAMNQEQILDLSATMRITDSQTGQVVGFWQRKGGKSMIRSEWSLLDANKNQYGKILEASGLMAILCRFIQAIPKKYTIEVSGQPVGTLTQKFQLIGDTWTMDMQGDPQKTVDRRMVVSGAILMDAMEQAMTG